jgi:O-methyltransferase
MKLSIRIARIVKRVFLISKMHVIFMPFVNIWRNAAYLTKLSKFAADNKNVTSFNDYPTWKFDYTKREKAYDFIIENFIKTEPIQYLEFGVCGGNSFKWWVEKIKNASSTFHGFDTFEGLPEDWGPFKKGDMGTNKQVPNIDDKRVHFYKGLFQQSFPQFTSQVQTNVKKVIHMDADLYSSTLYILTSIAPYLQKGDIIIFDEFMVPTHEYLAYDNFVKSYYINLKLIAAANNYYFAAFEVA